jgi:hypothetical protein
MAFCSQKSGALTCRRYAAFVADSGSSAGLFLPDLRAKAACETLTAMSSPIALSPLSGALSRVDVMEKVSDRPASRLARGR